MTRTAKVNSENIAVIVKETCGAILSVLQGSDNCTQGWISVEKITGRSQAGRVPDYHNSDTQMVSSCWLLVKSREDSKLGAVDGNIRWIDLYGSVPFCLCQVQLVDLCRESLWREWKVSVFQVVELCAAQHLHVDRDFLIE